MAGERQRGRRDQEGEQRQQQHEEWQRRRVGQLREPEAAAEARQQEAGGAVRGVQAQQRQRPREEDADPDVAENVVPELLPPDEPGLIRSEEHTSELQSPDHLVCRLLLEKKKTTSRTA